MHKSKVRGGVTDVCLVLRKSSSSWSTTAPRLVTKQDMPRISTSRKRRRSESLLMIAIYCTLKWMCLSMLAVSQVWKHCDNSQTNMSYLGSDVPRPRARKDLVSWPKKKKLYTWYLSLSIRRLSLVCVSMWRSHLRYDALAQMLTLSNIHAGSKVLVFETCAGLVLGAVMERMGGRFALRACVQLDVLERLKLSFFFFMQLEQGLFLCPFI